MTGNHEGLLEHSVTRKAFLQYAKSLFAKKSIENLLSMLHRFNIAGRRSKGRCER